jgi:hypothetical protein
MFLLYTAPGALLPLYSLRLQELGFTEMQMACCCATQAVASVVASLVAGQVADRWFPAERCLAVCSLLAGLDLWLLAGLTTPGPVFVATLAFWLLAGPTTLLGATICFTHLRRPDRDYGPTRMWGTVGWMVSGWLLGYWFCNPAWLCRCVGCLRPHLPHSELADAFRLGGVMAFVIAGYALTLPHTPPQRRGSGGGASAPLEALKLLRTWSFATYCLCALGVCVTLPFTTQGTPLLLQQLGVPRPWMGPTLTLSQAAEVLSLGLLPMILMHLRVRGTMVMGLAAWTASLAILAVGRPAGLVIGSLGFNGLVIGGFVVAGQVYVNRQAHGGLRASVQALLTCVNGLGLLAGNLLVGWLRYQAGGELPQAFAVAAAINGALLVVFLFGFRERSTLQSAVVPLPPGARTKRPSSLLRRLSPPAQAAPAPSR